MENIYKVTEGYGVTIEEMSKAITCIPAIPFTEIDIVLIQSNPNLSWFQKWKLIREVKKNMVME